MTQMNKRPYVPPRQGARPQAQRRGASARSGAAAGGAQTRRAPAGGAQIRRTGARRSGRGPTGELLILAVGGLVVIAVAFFLQMAMPNGFPLRERAADGQAVRQVTEIHTAGPLRINEIMSGNRRTLTAGDASSPDWIEVANVGDRALNLRGYALSKTSDDANVFTFPELQLEPGACALVLADSRLRTDAADNLHAPFRLSSAGDTLMLFNAAGTAVDTVNLPALEPDQSYARVSEGQWQLCSTPTPGQPNTAEGYRALTEPDGDSPVVVTELMSTNRSTLADETGVYCDYIELYNRSAEAVELTGWHLSDDPTDVWKWSFPQLSLGPGETLVVFASRLDRRDDPTHLHTNFALSSEGEQVVLSDAQGKVRDRVEFDLLKADVAWTRMADGSWSSAAAPSPGRVDF